MKTALSVLCLVLSSPCCMATCFEQAAREQAVPEYILRAFSMVESSGCKKLDHQRNSNGTLDYGCMGINSTNLPALRRFGLSVETLTTDHCASVRAGAWIFAGMVDKYGLTWRAVGAYGVGTRNTEDYEQARRVYANKVKAALVELAQQGVLR